MKDLLSKAQRYCDVYGWSIIPVKGKKPNVRRWGPYKKERPTDKELRDFFDLPGTTGLGVICGAISDNLVVRDFDEEVAYHRWADAQPKLAKQLPTSRTRRGFHVYFRCGSEKRIITFDDGELRGNGCIVAPPSKRRGGKYQWVVPPKRAIPVLESPEDAGLVGVRADSFHAAIPAEPTNSLHVSVCVPATVEEAISRTLPTGPGQRNRQVFDLALMLKALIPDATPTQLRKVVKDWHGQALPVIRTKDLSITWSDFIIAWRRIDSLPVNMAAIVAESRSTPPPPVAMQYDDARVQLLVTLCSCLQRRWGERSFFLSVRTVADVVDVDKNTASNWLQMLVFDGILKCVRKGTMAGRRASEWRYLGDVSLDPQNRPLT